MGKSRRPLLVLFLVWALFLSKSSGAKTYKICSYNVQNFNVSKLDGLRILHLLTKVLSICDVCLLQEVRDLDGEAMKKLVSSLNGYNGFNYDYVASGGLGRGEEDKEQYVFLYRKQTTTIVDQYQYPDEKKGSEDAFSREPFIVYFNASQTVIGEFVLIPLRVEPEKALEEIDALYDVVTEIKKKWQVENIMLLGDFQADCGYVTKTNRRDNRLFGSLDLFWLIKDDADTTVTDMTDCAYDRFVVHGQTFLRGIVPLSAKVFNFKKVFKISMNEVLEISDHYPIHVDLKVKSSGQQQALLQPCIVLLTLITIVLFPA
ncbi:hypothetical protein ACEWY4_000584 [Coilia grayii]|uniref:Deoxyribonuclease n=1 Tax=Coilia grayii TaxID=363190 RepID=A0ABD1KXI4_9TELE